MTTSQTSSSAVSTPLPAALAFDDVELLIGTANTSMAQALQQQFSQWGYGVSLASDAAAIPPMIEQIEPDAVILDLDWCPNVSPGEDLEAPDVDHPPMVIITLVPPDMPVTNSGFPACADAIIPYPEHPTDLVPWIHSLLRTKQRFETILDENQRLAEKAAQLEQLRRQILGVTIHELSTPFMQIKAAIYLLKEGIYHDVDDENQRIIDMADQASKRMDESIEVALSLKRSFNTTLGPTSIPEIINVARTLLTRKEALKDQIERITDHLPSDLPPVLADARALSRLLQLLLDNALKFSPSDSPIDLIAKHHADTETVWIGVRDQGIGIAKEEQELIFKDFYQVDLTDSRRHNGMGNGLALAGLLAQSMNTSIEVESELGEGSTFSFILPVFHLDDMLDDLS